MQYTPQTLRPFFSFFSVTIVAQWDIPVISCVFGGEGVEVNCPQQHSVADHIRCYFFWCETHSIKASLEASSEGTRKVRRFYTSWGEGGVYGWVGTVCFAFDRVSQANLYKGIREKHCLLCSTAYGKRRMSWSSARYMRATEVLWWWIPQYCTFVAACIHPPVIYSVLGRTKVCPSVHLHVLIPCISSLSLLSCPPEIYLSLLVIAG